MQSNQIQTEQQTAAKVAALASLGGIAIVVFATYVLYNPLMVPGNVAATMRNIIEHETQFRAVIAGNILHGAAAVVLLTALYVILKPVNRGLALVAAAFRLLYALSWLFIALDFFRALRLVSGASYLGVMEPERLQALARLYLSGGFDGYYVGLLFYGLASTITAYLFFRSGYIPKALAAFGIIACAWCVICTLIFYVYPGFGKAINLYSFDSALGLWEIATSIWLLAKGLRPGTVSAVRAARV